MIDANKLLRGTTPGPWKAIPYEPRIGSPWWGRVELRDRVPYVGIKEIANAADACLIAAAPDLAREHAQLVRIAKRLMKWAEAYSIYAYNGAKLEADLAFARELLGDAT